MKLNDDFLIGGWSAINESVISDKISLDSDLRDFTEAGFNLTGIIPFEDDKKLKWVLDALKRYNIKYLFECRDSLTNINSVEISDKVKKYCTHPNCIGVFLKDEPSSADYALLLELKKEYERYLPKDVPAIGNLFPNYANADQLGIKPFGKKRLGVFTGAPSKVFDFLHEEYYEYVESYMHVVSPKVLSYDHYIISEDFRTNENLREQYIYRFIENLSVISEISKKHSVPFWNVIQSLSYCNYMISPDFFEYRWMANISYVYGSKNNISFVYRNEFEEGGGVEKWYDAPLTLSGKKTFEYDVVKKVNLEIHNFAKEFLKFEHIGVTGYNLPKFISKAVLRNTVKNGISDIKNITGDISALIGVMQKENKNGLLIMNTDIYVNKKPNDSKIMNIEFEEAQSYEIWGREGLENQMTGKEISLSLDNSEAKFIRYTPCN